jgi:hypothetical protein
MMTLAINILLFWSKEVNQVPVRSLEVSQHDHFVKGNNE